MKKHEGVEVRGNTVRVTFNYNGRRREVLKRDGAKLSPTPENLKYAARLRRSIVDAIALGKFTVDDYRLHFPDSKVLKTLNRGLTDARLLKEFLWLWFNQQEHKRKPSANKAYKSAIREFENEWPVLLGEDFKLPIAREWIAKRQKQGTTVRTIRNRLIPLRGALDMMVEMEIIETNHLRKLGNLEDTEQVKVRQQRIKEIDPFDLSDVRAILAAANDPQIQNFMEFNLNTGLRTGEMFGLAWEDVDLNKRIAHIQRARTENHLLTPKTPDANRVLDFGELPEAAWAALVRQREHTFMKPPIDCGDFGELRFVFYNPRQDKPFTDDQSFRAGYWKQVLKRSGVRYRYPYQMRHTFASTACSMGENPKWVAKVLGHVNEGMVIRNYGKWLEESAAAAGRTGGAMMRAALK